MDKGGDNVLCIHIDPNDKTFLAELALSKTNDKGYSSHEGLINKKGKI